MSIAIKKTTTVVLFAFLLAGLFVLLGQMTFAGHDEMPPPAPNEPFHIKQAGASTGCGANPIGTIKCCTDFNSPSCDWGNVGEQECEIWADLYCGENWVSKVQDFVGDFCVSDCTQYP